MLTQKELKDLFNYSKKTGNFVRLKPRGGQYAGDIAGSKNTGGYVMMAVNGKRYLSHRLAFLYVKGKFPKEFVDHIDHNRSNNCWENLREAGYIENSKNRSRNKNNTSGHTGVSICSRSGKWQVRLMIKSKQTWFGRYTEKEDAIAAMKVAMAGAGCHENHGKGVNKLFNKA